MGATPEFPTTIASYRENIVMAVECMLTWYRAADLCAQEPSAHRSFRRSRSSPTPEGESQHGQQRCSFLGSGQGVSTPWRWIGSTTASLTGPS
jgi:hypothetical protein